MLDSGTTSVWLGSFVILSGVFCLLVWLVGFLCVIVLGTIDKCLYLRSDHLAA